MSENKHISALKKPLLFGLGHGAAFSLGWCSFMLNFFIAEYNDPVTGELVLYQKYSWLCNVCEWTLLISLLIGLMLIILNCIELIRDKKAGVKVRWYLITLPIAIAAAYILSVAGTTMISLFKDMVI